MAQYCAARCIMDYLAFFIWHFWPLVKVTHTPRYTWQILICQLRHETFIAVCVSVGVCVSASIQMVQLNAQSKHLSSLSPSLSHYLSLIILQHID